MNRSQRIVLVVAGREDIGRLLENIRKNGPTMKVKGVVTSGIGMQSFKRNKTGAEMTRIVPESVSEAAAALEAPDDFGVPVVATLDTLIPYLEDHAVDEIVFAAMDTDFSHELIYKCRLMGITVHQELRAAEGLPGLQTVENIAGIPMLTCYMKMVTPGQQMAKRLMDIAGGLIGLLATGVIALFVIPAIRISDPGPAFFSQERVGKNGRVFRIYKFRSMYQDAEKRKQELMDKNNMKGLMFKMDADPRVIGSGPDGTRHGLGHFLRASSLDEFPQFWNVLKGDMSLVGTRPPTVDEWRKYDLHHRARLAAKPGITGMWQVSGRSDITDFEEVVKLDTEYIQNWSLLLDIKILLMTVAVVLTRRGSK